MKPLTDLPAEIQNYLKEKWSTQIIDINRNIKRLQAKLKRLTDKKLFYEFEVNGLTKKLHSSTNVLEHLKNTHAPQETIEPFEKECQELKEILEERKSLLNEFNDADAYMQILRIKELEQAVTFRQNFLEEMGE